MTLSDNTTKIQQLIDSINALPEAGSGTSVETCTVSLEPINDLLYAVEYVGFDTDGTLKTIDAEFETTESISVLVNTYVRVCSDYMYDIPSQTGDIECLEGSIDGISVFAVGTAGGSIVMRLLTSSAGN